MIVVACLVGGCATTDTPLDERPSLVALSEGWSMRWTDGHAPGMRDPAWLADDAGWAPLPDPGFFRRSQSEYLWLRVRLPAQAFDRPAVRLGPVGMELDAFVSGRRVYTFGVTDPARFQSHGYRWHLIDLPDDYQGGWLHLRIRSRYTHVGMAGTAYVAERGALIEDVFRRDLGRLLASALMAALAAGALLTLLFQRRHWRNLLSLAAFSAFAAIYSTSHTHVKDLLLDRPMLWLHLWMASLCFLPVALLVLIEHYLGPWPGSRFRRLWQAQLGFAVAWNTYSIVIYNVAPEAWAPAHFAVAVLVARLLVITDIVVGIVVLVGESRAGRPEPHTARLILIGVLAVSIAATHDLLAAFGFIQFRLDSVAVWAWLLFTIALAVILARRINEQIRQYAGQLEVHQRDRELMIRDLHDGLGALTTNIRLLAQVAQTTNDGSSRDKAIHHIEELSANSLAEIRQFVQSSDSDDLDWAALTHDLRRFGAQLLEAHGIAFRLTAEIEAPTAPLTGLASYHLRKVVSEALTNVIKHSDASAVDIHLRVDADAARVTITDDGPNADHATVGVDSGAGLSNMRSRAEQLGGDFSFTSLPHRGHVLDLAFPTAAIRQPTRNYPTPAAHEPILKDARRPATVTDTSLT